MPEDEVEGSSEIYYFTDEDGHVHSREFLAQELIPDDAQDLEASLKRKPSHGKVERLKPGTTGIINLVPAPEEMQREITLPMPKSGARPLDIRISSEVAPDLPIKEVSRPPSCFRSFRHFLAAKRLFEWRSEQQISTRQNVTAELLAVAIGGLF